MIYYPFRRSGDRQPVPRRIARTPAQPIRVRVAAGRLHWPMKCACCMGEPDTEFVEVLRPVDQTLLASTTHGSRWRIPYCSRCVEHSDAYLMAKKKQDNWPRNISDVVRCGLALAAVGLVTVLAYVFCLGAPARVVGNLVGACCVLLALVAVVGALNAQDLRHWQDRVEAGMKDCCRVAGQAVLYQGGQADVHTFVLFNPDYAAAFIAANLANVIP